MKYDTLNQSLDGRLIRDEVLAPHTTFGIGGPASYFLEASTPIDIIRTIRACKSQNIRFFILGGGSNILFDDKGFDGMVIKDLTARFRINGTKVSALSGAIIDKMVDKTVELGLGGMEYAAGIRGTIGGAVYGNAGAFGHAINEVLKSAVILTDAEGKIELVDNDYFKFRYRKSKLSDTRDTVLSVRLELWPEDKKRLTEVVNERRQFRKDRHPVGLGCAGSVFKNLRSLENPEDVTPAGKLLEQAGVRGMTVGDAAVFEKHCNIVVNRGRATSADVKTLVARMQKAVKDNLGLDLEREILYIDP